MMHFIYQYTPLHYFIQSFWRDEAFSYVMASKSIGDILYYTARDFNPPLYYIVLHIWMMIFGHSEIALRTVSLLFFWGTIYTAFDFMHFVLNIRYKRAVYYMVFMIINPVLLYYAFEARMYTMLAFFASLSYFAFHTNRKKLYIFSLIAGLFTHYFMICVVATQFVYTIITRKKNQSWKELVKPFAIPLLVFIPWLIYVYTQKQGLVGTTFWIPKVKIKDFFIIPGVLYTGMETFLDYFFKKQSIYIFSLISITLVSLAAIVSGYIKIKKSENNKDLEIYISLLLWAFLPPVVIFILSFFKPTFLPRYLIFSTVGILLLIIYSLEHLRPKARILLVSLLVLLTIHHLSLQMVYRSKEDMDKVIGEIKALSKKNDVLYVNNDLDYFTAVYYFGENRVFIYNKSYDQIPDYVGKTLISEDKIKYELPFYPQKAFILEENRKYDISASY